MTIDGTREALYGIPVIESPLVPKDTLFLMNVGLGAGTPTIITSDVARLRIRSPNRRERFIAWVGRALRRLLRVR